MRCDLCAKEKRFGAMLCESCAESVGRLVTIHQCIKDVDTWQIQDAEIAGHISRLQQVFKKKAGQGC